MIFRCSFGPARAPLGSRVLVFRYVSLDSNLFDTNVKTNVLNGTIEYGLSTKRFEEPLFQ